MDDCETAIRKNAEKDPFKTLLPHLLKRTEEKQRNF